jgi:hypothetical protein
MNTTTIAAQVAELRAAMIVRRAIRVGANLLRTEADRAVSILVKAGLSMLDAVRVVVVAIGAARRACAA